jgi:hypothetical protein
MREYDEGLLVIDFLDPGTRTLLWRGIVRNSVRFQEEPETREQRIYQSVAAALRRILRTLALLLTRRFRSQR